MIKHTKRLETMNFTQTDQNTLAAFSEHPLSSLFYQYINTLEEHHFHKETEDLLQVARRYYLPENRDIIAKIIIEMKKAALSEELYKFKQLALEL